jgi:opacity protein-like surface antigen
MLKKGQLLKTSQLSTVTAIALLTGVIATPKALAEVEQVETQTQSATVIDPAIKSTENELPTFVLPTSYTALDLVASDSLLAQQIQDLDAFCEAYPFNSRCLDRDFETEAELETETEVSEDDQVIPERNNRFYVRVGGGLQNRESAEDFIGRATFDTGYNLYGAIGYRFLNLRTELEYKYFNNDFDELTFFQQGTTTPVPGPPETSPGANVDGRALMFNLYYDLDTGSRFRPYVGGGVGFYTAEINDLSPPTFGGFVANGVSDDRFAYQLQAGISYIVTENLDVSLGYRYFKGDRFDYEIEGFTPNLEPNGLESNTIELNVLYNF